MRIDRQDLLERLKIVEPALASKDLVEDLVQLWFRKDHVLAYNGTLCLEAPIATTFLGGLRGDLLLGILGKSRAREVDFGEPDKQGIMIVKAAGAKLRLPLLEPKRCPAPVDPKGESSAIAITDAFLDGLRSAAFSIGTEQSVPQQTGATLATDKQHLIFYSTDAKTATRVLLPRMKGLGDVSLCWPEVFCRQVIRLAKAGDRLTFFKDRSVLVTKDNVIATTRLLDISRPLDFGHIFERNTYDPKQSVEVSSRIEISLERLGLVVDKQQEERCLLQLADGKLRLEAKSAIGELTEVLEAAGDHEPIEVLVDPALLLRACREVKQTRMTITGSALIMRGGEGITHLISTRAKPSKG